MKKRMKGLLAVLLLLSMLPVAAFATIEYCDGNHDWSDWSTRMEPTCTEPGTKYRQCYRCYEWEDGTIPALGHDYGEWEIQRNPTCRENGVRVRYCKRCQDVQTEAM